MTRRPHGRGLWPQLRRVSGIRGKGYVVLSPTYPRSHDVGILVPHHARLWSRVFWCSAIPQSVLSTTPARDMPRRAFSPKPLPWNDANLPFPGDTAMTLQERDQLSDYSVPEALSCSIFPLTLLFSKAMGEALPIAELSTLNQGISRRSGSENPNGWS